MNVKENFNFVNKNQVVFASCEIQVINTSILIEMLIGVKLTRHTYEVLNLVKRATKKAPFWVD